MAFKNVALASNTGIFLEFSSFVLHAVHAFNATDSTSLNISENVFSALKYHRARKCRISECVQLGRGGGRTLEGRKFMRKPAENL